MTVMVAGDEYRAECDVWQNITDNISEETNVPMNCEKNSQCTGIDCSCEFSYSVSYTGLAASCGREFEVHRALKVSFSH